MIACTLFISTLHPLLSFVSLPSLALLYVVCALCGAVVASSLILTRLSRPPLSNLADHLWLDDDT